MGNNGFTKRRVGCWSWGFGELQEKGEKGEGERERPVHSQSNNHQKQLKINIWNFKKKYEQYAISVRQHATKIPSYNNFKENTAILNYYNHSVGNCLQGTKKNCQRRNWGLGKKGFAEGAIGVLELGLWRVAEEEESRERERDPYLSCKGKAGVPLRC